MPKDVNQQDMDAKKMLCTVIGDNDAHYYYDLIPYSLTTWLEPILSKKITTQTLLTYTITNTHLENLIASMLTDESS